MSYREAEHLRVLIAKERKHRLALVAPTVASLGHEVIARELVLLWWRFAMPSVLFGPP